MVFDFCLQILEVIGNFVFSVTRASEVGIGNRDRRWKTGSERLLLAMIRSAYVHIQSDQISV